MALKFLNKKGWHTGSLRNIENVWKAEQKAQAEKRKLEELQKQIREEQDQYEFRKLQEQAGLVPKQERLDFLYESGLGVGKPSSDEYLLGKPLEESKADDVLQQVAAAPGSLFVEEKISANDQWRKIRSDPLLLIKQQELAARERIKNNPLKMEALRKEVEFQKNIKLQKKEEKKRLKAEEKQKRKELKRELKKKQKMSDGSEANPEDDKGVESSRKRGRLDSPVSDDDHREERNEDRKGDDDSRRDRRRRHDSPASGDEADRNGRGEDSRSDRRRRHDSPVSDEDDSRGRKRSRYGDESSSRHRAREDFDRNRVKQERSPDRIEVKRERSPVKRERSPDRSSSVKRERSPDRSERRRSPLRSSGKPPLPRKKVQLSDEEKAARLREMQQDAELHEEQRWSRIKKASVSDAIEEEKDSVKTSKNFLNEASRNLYGAEDDGKSSVADTLHRRSHYREKFSDTNAFRKI